MTTPKDFVNEEV